jgi:hypothetical protein
MVMAATSVADIDRERRAREISYALARLHEVVELGRRHGWPELTAEALRQISVLEVGKDGHDDTDTD